MISGDGVPRAAAAARLEAVTRADAPPGRARPGGLDRPGGAGASARDDARVIGLVAGAHFFSHFFQLVLPPLFPVLRDAFGVSYVALAFLMTVFFAASGVGQFAAGFLVDRLGPRRVLLTGLTLLAGAIGLAGLSPSYPALVPIVLLAGLGNSVFHPADYSILNARVTPGRLGRAYGAHGIGGNLGWAAAPAVVVGLSGLLGWRAALVAVGGLGLAAAAVLAGQEALADRGEPRLAPATRRAWLGDARLLLAAPIILAFGYFCFLSAALIALQTFAVSALVGVFQVPLALATGALTAFLLGNSVGIVLGGVLADRAARHDVVAATGLWLATALVLLVAGAVPAPAWLGPVLALTGLAMGATQPSRDLLVRGATPRGASGKVFGFVYSGLDAGALVLAPLYGWLLDRGEPRLVFVAAAGFLVLTSLTVFGVRSRSVAARARA